VVHYAVERKIARGEPDYWDYVTRLELAVLREKEEDATNAVADALACVREWGEQKPLQTISASYARRVPSVEKGSMGRCD
jgi:hypothetical protein